jgi:hypothetical protein
MSNTLITRLVVGEPSKIRLGKPVGQSTHSEDDKHALRWKDGAWVGQATPRLASLFRRSPPKTFKLPTRRLAAVPGRKTVWTAAAVVLVVVGAGLGSLLRAPNAGFLPIAPAAQQDHVQAVKVVNAPYAPPQQDSTGSAATTTPIPGLPIAVANGGGGESSASSTPTQVSAPTPSPAKNAAKPPAKDQPAEQQQKPPAVVLDEVAPQRPAPAPHVASKPSPPAVKTDAPAKAPVAAVPRGTGLVAITPDGKSAVFTNPKTRLPEQFKVGDQLPGGETIRSIDNNSGKVLTSSKEYHLD